MKREDIIETGKAIVKNNRELFEKESLLVEASEDNKQCGWTLCPNFLTKIHINLANQESPSSLEQIEDVLLTWKRLKQNNTQ